MRTNRHDSMNENDLKATILDFSKSGSGSRILAKGGGDYDFAKISKKLHEIEKNLAHGGDDCAHAGRVPPPQDPLLSIVNFHH